MTALDTTSMVDELRHTVDALRQELADLRQQLTTEVRTHRLVVIGPDGSKRITTSCRDHSTSLRVEIVSTTDPGVGRVHPVSAELWASLGDSGHPEGDEISKASLDLSTGDDSYALLQQIAMLSADRRTVTERGTLSLYQQRRRRGLDDKFVVTDGRVVQVDHQGVTEQGDGKQVVAYSPLVRMPS